MKNNAEKHDWFKTFLGPTCAQFKTDKADRSQNVSKNYEIIQEITHRASDIDVLQLVETNQTCNFNSCRGVFFRIARK